MTIDRYPYPEHQYLLHGELKPCPCCGKTPIIQKTIVPDGNMHFEEGRIVCSGCGLSTGGSVLDGYYGIKGSIKDEIEKWNRRADIEHR